MLTSGKLYISVVAATEIMIELYRSYMYSVQSVSTPIVSIQSRFIFHVYFYFFMSI